MGEEPDNPEEIWSVFFKETILLQAVRPESFIYV